MENIEIIKRKLECIKEMVQEVEDKIESLKVEDTDKFAELKEAYRNGAVIEFFSLLSNKWCELHEEPQWYSDFEYRIKPEETTLLESESKKLEIGRWYKSPNGGLFCVTSYDGENYRAYGFDVYGNWTNVGVFGKHAIDNDVEATPQEVESALIEEAKRRYKFGDEVKSLVPWHQVGNLDFKEVTYRQNNNDLWISGGNCNINVFDNGKWAEIIKPEEGPKIGDVCKFWYAHEDDFVISILIENDKTDVPYRSKLGGWYKNAKKLTKEEAIKLLFGKGE